MSFKYILRLLGLFAPSVDRGETGNYCSGLSVGLPLGFALGLVAVAYTRSEATDNSGNVGVSGDGSGNVGGHNFSGDGSGNVGGNVGGHNFSGNGSIINNIAAINNIADLPRSSQDKNDEATMEFKREDARKLLGLGAIAYEYNIALAHNNTEGFVRILKEGNIYRQTLDLPNIPTLPKNALDMMRCFTSGIEQHYGNVGLDFFRAGMSFTALKRLKHLKPTTDLKNDRKDYVDCLRKILAEQQCDENTIDMVLNVVQDPEVAVKDLVVDKIVLNAIFPQP